MEVHHHSPVKNKHFREYFFEFLMLFLAVTLGFFAENLREYFTENDHAQKLTEQLVQDLKSDTVNLNRNIEIQRRQLRHGDSLYAQLQQPCDKIDSRKIEYDVDSCYQTTYFTSSSGAMTAITNSLQLRRFAHSRIVSYISDYEDLLTRVRVVETAQIQNLRNYFEPFIIGHFQPANARAILMNDSKDTAGGGGKGAHCDVTHKNELVHLSPEDLNQLAIRLTIFEIYQDDLKSHYKEIKAKAADFLVYLNKEYSVE